MNSPSVDYEQLELLPAGSLSGHPSPKIAQRLKTVMGHWCDFLRQTIRPKCVLTGARLVKCVSMSMIR